MMEANQAVAAGTGGGAGGGAAAAAAAAAAADMDQQAEANLDRQVAEGIMGVLRDNAGAGGAPSSSSSSPPSLPPDMAITTQERDWALEIKDFVEKEDSGLRPISDMEYAQHAIISQGDLNRAIQRIQGLQEFRDLYRVQDNAEEGMAILERYIQIQPGALIYVDIVQGGEEGICAFHQGLVIPARAHVSEEFWRVHILMYYYLFQIMQPTLRSCRQGIFNLVEGSGMRWENFDAHFEQRLHDEMWMHYPVRVKRLMIYNTNSMVNMAWSIMKRFLPQELRGVMELGCQIEWDDNPDNPKLSLDSLYLMPDYLTAMQHLIHRARRFLTLRYYNTKFFRL